jgi:glyoxylase-like metal-dependent hydrolase (beta-lactamase superfamily II)
MVLCEVATARGPLLFCADLIPGVPWVRRAITMGYDRYPEQLIDEKTALLADLHDRGGRLFFTHDPQVAACGLERDEAGALVAAAPVAALRGEA